MTPHIVSLLPTFARPWLACSAIKQWLDQTHPLQSRDLIVGCDVDDPAAFKQSRLREAIEYEAGKVAAARVHVLALPGDLTLPEKYNRMGRYALGFPCPNANLITVWEDDDLYLPGHLARIASAWNRRNRPELWWGHPRSVWSDYTGDLEIELAQGRFHAALAFTPAMLDRVGWWPATNRPDFDQQLLGSLQAAQQTLGQYDIQRPGLQPQAQPTYVFLWHTGSTHGQHTMDSGLDWQAQSRQRLFNELSVRPWDLIIRVEPRTVRLRDVLTQSNRDPSGPTVTLTQAGIAAARVSVVHAIPRLG